MEISADGLVRLRLAAQSIDPIGGSDVAGTVRNLVAMQAQDFAGALWAVGLRTAGATRTTVLDALERGDVVRTLPMRGTLHFVASEDLRWMLGLTAQGTLQSAASRFRNLGLDAEVLGRARVLAQGALEGGNSLSREEFMTLLSANGIAPEGQRGYHVIFYLCQVQLICWGPPRGTQQALVLVDEWIAPTPARDRQEALESFALRYFASHGPATEHDFAWWTKLTLRDIRTAIQGLGNRLSVLSHDGTDYYVAASALEGGTFDKLRDRDNREVHLLPGFDEYLLGYQDRSLALSDEHFQRVVPGNNGIFLPMIVSDGAIVGTWRRTAKSKTFEIKPEHFDDATAAQLAGLQSASADYVRFMAG